MSQLSISSPRLTFLGALALLTLCGGVTHLQAQGKAAAGLKAVELERENLAALKTDKKTRLRAFVPQVGHSRKLSSMSLSADGKLLATASGLSDGVVKVWDVTSWRLLRTLDGEDFVSLSPDGTLLASGNVGGPVKVWQTSDWKLVKELKASGPVHFTADGAHLVTEADASGRGGKSGELELWEVKTWRAKKLLNGHEASISALAMSADGRFLATGSYDEAIKLWDLTKNEVVRTFTEQVRTASALAISPDAKLLAVAYQGSQTHVELWDTSTSKLTQRLEVGANITQLDFSPDLKRLAAASADGKTRIWKLDALKAAPQVLEGGGQVIFLPDGERIIHGEQGFALRALSATAPERVVASHDATIMQSAFSGDGKTLITTDASSRVDLWDVKSGAHKQTLQVANTHGSGPDAERIGELVLSPSGALIAQRPFQGSTIKLWYTGDNMKLAHEIKLPDLSSVSNVTFAPNERELIIESSGDDGTRIVWWDLAKNEQINATKLSGYVSVDGFVDEGRNAGLVSTGSASGKARLSLKLWERDTGLLGNVSIAEVPPFSGDVALSERGAQVALGDQDYSVKVMDRSSGKIINALSGHTDLVNMLHFSPDGALLASASWDQTARIWDVARGTALLTLADDMQQAQHISFSPTDATVVVAYQSFARVVHLPTGRTRSLYLGDAGGWMVHEGGGTFTCEGSGCAFVAYQTEDGEWLGAAEPRIANARKTATLGR